jgi:hypothetical protein
MRLSIVAAVLPGLLVPALAAANPVTIGAGVGVTQSDDSNTNGNDPNQTLGIFGRFGFAKQVAAQLEVEKVETDSDTSIRRLTATVVIDLIANSHWVPILYAGAGIDRANGEFESADAHHFEGGVGIEFRADGGFTIGLDIRLGGRSIDNRTSKAIPFDDAAGDIRPLFAPAPNLDEGEYRSARLSLGIQF